MLNSTVQQYDTVSGHIPWDDYIHTI